jgi:uncharacterized membrane protein
LEEEDFPAAGAALAAGARAAIGKIGTTMHHKHFLNQLDDAKIVAAIERAEHGTSAPIRVCVAHRKRPDVLAAAQACFRKLHLHGVPQRNAVLIYFSPAARQFAVWGDTGAHEKCGEALWTEVAAGMTAHLKDGRYTEAVVQAIERLGEALARHFPRAPGGPEALPDAVVRE